MKFIVRVAIMHYETSPSPQNGPLSEYSPTIAQLKSEYA